MKCSVCKGTGKTYKASVDLYSRCDNCRGTGYEQPMTNEEWLCQLSTVEKARFLASNKMLNFDYQMWLEWLKEKHDEM